MVSVVLLIIIIILGISILYLHYGPSIEILEVWGDYEVYIEYNHWEDSSYKGRTQVHLFTI